MASSLLSKSLGEVKNQGGRPERERKGPTARNSPYTRPGAGGWAHDKYAATVDVLPSQRLDKSGREKRSVKLHITNLHYEVSERELELLFLQIGPLALPPSIKFDRSGRSEGVAWITYTSEADAAKAKQAFNGAPAKGQNITVEFDYRPVYLPPAPGTLLARLEQDSRPKKESIRGVPTGPRADAGKASIRGVGGARGGAIGSRGGRGGGNARGGGGAGGNTKGGKATRKPKEATSTGDLDKELEDFLAINPTAVVPAVVVSETTIPEVEMS